MESKWKQNEVVFLVQENRIVKGIIEEIIFHYTRKDLIVKYIVRPYGFPLDNCVAANDDEVVETIEEARHIVKQRLQGIFDSLLIKLDNTTNEKFDNLETEFQKKEKR